MCHDTYRGAIFWLIAIVAFCGSAVLFAVGIYDYGRGAQIVEFVPICQANSCLIMPQDAAEELMAIFDSRSTSKGSLNNGNASWLGIATSNLCSLPGIYLRQYQSGENLLQVNKIFSAIGLSEIIQDKDSWLIMPGRAVDSIFDIFRKMADPFFADYSCYKPYFRYYGFLILGLFWIGFYALRKAK